MSEQAKTEAKTEPKTTRTRLCRKESKCTVEGCKRPYRAKGYCNVHYKRWRTGGVEGHKARYKICGKEACRKPVFIHGLCEEHSKSGEAKAS